MPRASASAVAGELGPRVVRPLRGHIDIETNFRKFAMAHGGAFNGKAKAIAGIAAPSVFLGRCSFLGISVGRSSGAFHQSG